jgi:DinB superfamily
VRATFLSLLLATPSLLQAQANSYPDLLSDWQRNRSAVLAYIDAMPDSATGFRPTPGVRTFAQQFDHIVTANLEVAARTLGQVVPLPQTERRHPAGIPDAVLKFDAH